MSDSGTTATSAAPLGIPLAAPERTWSGDNEGPGLTRCGLRVSVPQRRTLWLTAANGYFCNPCMQFVRLKRRSYCGVHGTLAANLNRFLTSRLLG